MLSVKNLVKIYKTKAGVDVRALDGVTIDFPEKGMVFLLGRSGSGKSTLLNVAGGLDYPTDGEVTVGGRSSKDFTVSDFDGYRNSCVGFVFQEFNILNEFNIEQNIALALQLQQRPNSAEDVEKILKMVDLSGVGKRKPNTLSGGQKQRVAIARALIKDPKIIMADEPTGALDSATGKQVLDTLKKLSETRLVVVVTHDRDFAFEYGDRIIELADGKVVSDISKVVETIVKDEEKNVTFIEENVVKVNDWSKVSDDEVKEIIDVLRQKGGSSYITTDQFVTEEVKQKEKSGCESIGFKATDTTIKKQEKDENIKFIKAKLPIKNALRMAFDSLRQKPIRLTFTILLSVVAFIFFGVASMFMLYSQNYSIATALEGSYYDSIVCNKEYDGYYISSEINKQGQTVQTKIYDQFKAAYSKEDLDALNQNNQGLKFAGIIDFGAYINNLDSVEGYFSKSEIFSCSQSIYSITKQYQQYFVVKGLIGFSDCGEEYISDCGYEIQGQFPRNHSEIVISKYMYSLFHLSGYKYNGKRVEIYSPTDLIGKTIKIGNMSFTVSGIIDVGEIPERFEQLYKEGTQLNTAGIIKLKNEFEDYLKSSFHTVGFVSEDFYEHYKTSKTISNASVDTRNVYGMKLSNSKIIDDVDIKHVTNAFTKKSVWKNDFMVNAYDMNGDLRNLEIGKQEVLLSCSYILQYVKFSKVGFCPIYDKIYELGLENQEKYANFLSYCRDYNSQVINYEVKSNLIDFLFSEYETLMGEPMTFPETVYMRSYKQKGWTSSDFDKHPEVPSDSNFKLDVVGFYYVTRGTYVDGLDKYFLSDDLCEEFGQRFSMSSSSTDNVVYFSDFDHDPENQIYGKIITPTQNKREQSAFILGADDISVRNAMCNQVYKNAVQIADVVNNLRNAFYIAGGIFGLFAILMLFNFISVTITSKMKEIGILRAVGARRQDVFKIFMIEALIITSACFIVSSILSIVACAVINIYATNLYGMAALEFTLINFLMLMFASLMVAFVATIWPVSRASNKAPVESIRSI